MLMPMMEIGIVAVPVPDRSVPMPMAMRFADRIFGAMRVLVMGVMNVPMLMLHHLVLVFMFMYFRQVQIDADRHEQTGTDKPSG